MKSENLKRLVYGGLFAAAIMISTAYIMIPNGLGGFIHIGDGLIFCSAIVLGPYASISAGIGSVLADLIAGYGIYAPVTFVIKTAMGLIAGLTYKAKAPKRIFFYIVAELIMLVGYFFYELLMGGFAKALEASLFNLVQAAFGVGFGAVLYPVLMKATQQNIKNKGNF